MVEEKAKQRIRRSGGRFYGVRANYEGVPCLPACIVRVVIDDPREIPYFLIWQDRWNEVKEAVRLVSLGHSEKAKSARWEYDWLST